MTDKLIQMARDHGMTLLPDGGHFPTPEQLAAFRAAVLADVVNVEPVGWLVEWLGIRGIEQIYKHGAKAPCYGDELDKIVPKEPVYSAATVAALTAERDALREKLGVATELLAKSIYYRWAQDPGYVLWVDGGNSLKQSEARQCARTAIAAGGKT